MAYNKNRLFICNLNEFENSYQYDFLLRTNETSLKTVFELLKSCQELLSSCTPNDTSDLFAKIETATKLVVKAKKIVLDKNRQVNG